MLTSEKMNVKLANIAIQKILNLFSMRYLKRMLKYMVSKYNLGDSFISQDIRPSTIWNC